MRRNFSFTLHQILLKYGRGRNSYNSWHSWPTNYYRKRKSPRKNVCLSPRKWSW